MSRSGARDTAEVWQVIAFFDSEYQNEYASIADCIGANSQLDKPYPTLELEKGDALLGINDQDIRHKSNDFVRKLIEDLESNKQEWNYIHINIIFLDNIDYVIQLNIFQKMI